MTDLPKSLDGVTANELNTAVDWCVDHGGVFSGEQLMAGLAEIRDKPIYTEDQCRERMLRFAQWKPSEFKDWCSKDECKSHMCEHDLKRFIAEEE